MRISFDLDDTLICDREQVLCEPNRIPFFFKPWINEPLRLGSCKLMKQLKQCCYGINVTGVINQTVHNAYLSRNSGYERALIGFPSPRGEVVKQRAEKEKHLITKINNCQGPN